MDKNLERIIKGCRKNDRRSQYELYKLYLNYGMTVCLRYAADMEEAREMVNDAFMKVFTKINEHYTFELSFKAWFNRILVNTAIDYFRKRQIMPPTVDIIHAQHYETTPDVIENLATEEVFELVQQLPPAYRLVFNMYVVDGFKHQEIANELGITVGASKSNLAKARMKLKAMISENEKIAKYVG